MAAEMIDGVHAVKIAKILAAGFCMAIGGIGSSVGQGFMGGKACEAISKKPESANTIVRVLFLCMLFAETSCIFALLVSLILLFT